MDGQKWQTDAIFHRQGRKITWSIIYKIVNHFAMVTTDDTLIPADLRTRVRIIHTSSGPLEQTRQYLDTHSL